jgi:hypothetical protein
MQTVTKEELGGIPVAVANVLDATVKFTKVEEYTTFLAEYAFVDGDIIIHFFPPREQYVQVGDGFKMIEEHLLRWQRAFPQVLSPVAEHYFKATLPVIMAQYIVEMTSWYFKAGGFARQLDPESFVLKFFAQLDQAIDAAYAHPTSS